MVEFKFLYFLIFFKLSFSFSFSLLAVFGCCVFEILVQFMSVLILFDCIVVSFCIIRAFDVLRLSTHDDDVGVYIYVEPSTFLSKETDATTQVDLLLVQGTSWTENCISRVLGYLVFFHVFVLHSVIPLVTYLPATGLHIISFLIVL